MNKYPVLSSNLTSVGYDEKKQILEITFRNGTVYQYANVPYSIYEGLMASPSKGKFFAARIRNAYVGLKIR